MKSRRAVLDSISTRPDTHAGLWLDKFLEDQTSEQSSEAEKGAKSRLLDQVAGLPVPDDYRAAFARREPSSPNSPERVVFLGEARVQGRCIVGLGQKGPTEIGIRLEHTWGVPILPGSSLKGLAAAAAHRLFGGAEWEKPASDVGRLPTSYDWLFGTTEDRGAVVFHDAWWVPGSAARPLVLDVMTVHHQGYYSTVGEVPPADTDSPNPVSFLTAVGSFGVAVEGPREWVEAAWALLEAGLRELGIGAKTNAGYGRLELTRSRTKDELRAEELKGVAAKLTVNLKAGTATEVFKQFATLAQQPGQSDAGIAALAKALVDGVERRKLWKEWIKKDSRKPEERELFERYLRPLLS